MKRVVLVALSGALIASSFPPYSTPGFVGLIGFIIGAHQVLKSSKPGWFGLLFGFGYFVVLLKWMTVVGTDTWIGLAAICSIWWGIAFTLIPRIPKNNLWSLKSALIFTACELLRDRIPFGGFGWGQIGVLSANSFFKSLVPVLGQVGMTLLLTLIAFEAIFVWERKQIRWGWFGALALTFVLAIPTANFGLSHSQDRDLNVSLVQGGVVHTGLGTFGPARSVLKNHAEVSLSYATTLRSQDLIVWPESSSDLDPLVDAESNRIIREVQSSLDVPLLIGANVEIPNQGVANDSILWSADGPHIIYQKRRLVPFGEFLPFRETIERYTDRAALMPRDFVSGHTPGKLNIKGVQLTVAICFEIADDSLAFDETSDSAAIIVHTNNATYQNLGQSEQQLVSAQMRALETQRTVISASTSGVSAIVAPTGDVIKQLSQSEVGILSTKISDVHGSTPAMLIHPFLVMVILLAALVVVIGMFRARKVTS